MPPPTNVAPQSLDCVKSPDGVNEVILIALRPMFVKFTVIGIALVVLTC